jgi:ferredoxin-NADP reductase
VTGTWTVQVDGRYEPTRSARTFAMAKQDGRRLARKHPGSHVVVKDPTGRVVLEWKPTT